MRRVAVRTIELEPDRLKSVRIAGAQENPSEETAA